MIKYCQKYLEPDDFQSEFEKPIDESVKTFPQQGFKLESLPSWVFEGENLGEFKEEKPNGKPKIDKLEENSIKELREELKKYELPEEPLLLVVLSEVNSLEKVYIWRGYSTNVSEPNPKEDIGIPAVVVNLVQNLVSRVFSAKVVLAVSLIANVIFVLIIYSNQQNINDLNRQLNDLKERERSSREEINQKNSDLQSTEKKLSAVFGELTNKSPKTIRQEVYNIFKYMS